MRTCPRTLIVVALCLVGSTAYATFSGVISGTVKDNSGQPVAGAYVKVTQMDRGLLFMVVSAGQGQFRIANLPPGKYIVQGIAGGFETDTSTVVDVADRVASVNLSLTNPQPEYPGMKQYLTVLTEEGPGKDLLVSKCTVCHDVGWALRRHMNHDAWERTVSAMQFNMQMKENFKAITDDEKNVLVDYLTRNFGSNTPEDKDLWPQVNSHLSRTPLSGRAAKYIAMEFRLPDKVSPHDVAVDSKGVAWVGERNIGNIGRFDPVSFTYTRIPLPPAAQNTHHRAPGTDEADGEDFRTAPFDVNAMAIDPKDHPWTVDGAHKRLLMYDPDTQQFTSYAIPYAGDRASMNTIRFHSDGSIWATEVGQNQLIHFFPDTKQFNFIVPPTPNSRPYGEAIDGRGTVWFVENGLPKIASVDPETGKITEYPLPEGMNSSRRMDTDADGNVWFGYYLAGALAKIDVRTGKITLHYTPTLFSGPYSVSIDKPHNIIWFSEQMANKIARYDPRTDSFVEFSLPNITDTRRVEVDRSNPNRVWYSGGGGDYPKVGYVEIIE